MSGPILVAEGVRKVYRSGGTDVLALKGLDLTVPQGEFLAVMGASGSGKTTLLNCLSGLDEIDDGRVIVEGHSIHELSDAKRTRHRAETMGFIFQAFNLIPGLHGNRERRAATPARTRAGTRGAGAGARDADAGRTRA